MTLTFEQMERVIELKKRLDNIQAAKDHEPSSSPLMTIQDDAHIAIGSNSRALFDHKYLIPISKETRVRFLGVLEEETRQELAEMGVEV